MKEYVLRDAGRREGSFGVQYQEELNPQQCEVVMAGDGPILVIAGAGSGKTRTVTYRVLRLLEKGVPPSQILLLTFTNKAAREMLQRVAALGAGGVPLLGGTFHHVRNRVLRKYGDRIGISPQFNILDRDDSKELINTIISGNRISKTHKKFPKALYLNKQNKFGEYTYVRDIRRCFNQGAEGQGQRDDQGTIVGQPPKLSLPYNDSKEKEPYSDQWLKSCEKSRPRE